MTIEVDFHDKDGYVLVDMKGTSEQSELLAAFEKILLYSSMKKASKMLVDCRGIEGNLPMQDISSISDKFSNIHTDYEGMMNNHVTFAFLIRSDHYDPNKINEALYDEDQDHSYVGSDFEEAEKWLLSKEVKMLQMA